MTVLSNLLFACVGTFAVATVLASWGYYVPLFNALWSAPWQPLHRIVPSAADAMWALRSVPRPSPCPSGAT